MKNVFLIGLAGLILTACNVPNVIPETQTSSARLDAQAVGVVYRVNTNLSVNAFHSIAEVYDFAATTGFNAGDSILFASCIFDVISSSKAPTNRARISR